MLRASRAIALAGVVLASIAGSGCRHAVEMIYKVQDVESGPRELVVRNDSGGVLTLLSAEAAPVATPMSPTTSVTIRFRVFRLSDIQRSSMGWFERRAGMTSTILVGEGPPRYIDMAGTDAAITIQLPDGQRAKFLVQLGECWFARPPVVTTLAVTGPPVAGVPAVPCP